MSFPDRLHCINPDCFPLTDQSARQKFCSRCGTSLQLCDRYLPLERLGAGGFAAIYTVWDLQERQERVLKVLSHASDKALKLFEREAIMLGNLRHPGIPSVNSDSFFVVPRPRQEPLYCLVMEKIVGPTLEEVLSDCFPRGCPESLIIDWLSQAAEILDVLHRSYVIHRDIKPSNLMLRGFRPPDPVTGTLAEGQLVLIDFGGVKQRDSTDSSTRLFSSGYSPPEQVAGQFVEPSADIYALGRTMIHLLTGQHPLELEDVQTGALQWHHAANASPVLIALLEEMVQWEMQKRPQSARALQQRLRKIPGTHFHRGTRFRQTMGQVFRRSQQHWVQSNASAQQNLARLSRLVKVTGAALFAITRSMWGGAIGAVCGTLLGFVLANWTPLGWKFADLVTENLPQLLAGVRIEAHPELLLFACVGLGTGWGLSQAGGYGQTRRRFSAASLGFLGYGMAWLLWTGMPYNAIARFLVAIAAASAILPLGLGFPSHLLFHAFAAAIGTTGFFALSLWQDHWSSSIIEELLSLSRLDLSVGFCALLGMGIAIGLGLSFYVFLPLIRWIIES
ncbi:serine/threonine-protein kinase [Oscillatoria sp. FACHB-1406]|uniref:serine/threonine protein kinase n=1 Tax=Oscillatoria sp. FACHB-1406 TaxID=2692846 RepID=UPI0016885FD3|nr:serine/threonine-protein kinase [Oscillatoria sp. FACHB-1406]MBD2576392.1 serine/threonine protein kinase [Oscillatoria sp. FACHB-1406]